MVRVNFISGMTVEMLLPPVDETCFAICVVILCYMWKIFC